MIGAPGAGKTMLAKRMPTILPPMTFEEALETSKVYSLAGLLSDEEGLVTIRPFRSPHHTVSDIALIGGGANPKPGEVSLAHNGILFLDEMLEFHKNVLEVLRQPLENGKVTVSRVLRSLDFPARFMMIAAMNPCPCGNLGDPVKECTCTPFQIQRYLNKLSQPLLDRMDIHLQMSSLKLTEMLEEKSGPDSDSLRQKVEAARTIQLERFRGSKIYCNSQMNNRMIEKFCQLSDESRSYLEKIMEARQFSARAYFKILKLARTIADIHESPSIQVSHIAQACQFRVLDKREALFCQ